MYYYVYIPQTELNFVTSVFIIKTWNMAVKYIVSIHLFDFFGFSYHLNSSGICLEPLM